jgi:hypothetical protein
MEKCTMTIVRKSWGENKKKKKKNLLPDACSQVTASCRKELACGAWSHRDYCFQKVSVDLLV